MQDGYALCHQSCWFWTLDSSKDYFRQDKDNTIKLPVKWLALESIHDAVFSERSDVVRSLIASISRINNEVDDFIICSGLLVWHAGRCSVVAKLPILASNHPISPNDWMGDYAWKSRTTQHALMKCETLTSYDSALDSGCKEDLLYIQWNLRAKNTMGTTIVSIVERMSSSWKFQSGTSDKWPFQIVTKDTSYDMSQN